MHACMYVCMYVCIHVCVYIYIYIYIYTCKDHRARRGPVLTVVLPIVKSSEPSGNCLRLWIGSIMLTYNPSLPFPFRGYAADISESWRNTIGQTIVCWLRKAFHGPQFTGMCVKSRGVRFRRISRFRAALFQRHSEFSRFQTAQTLNPKP